MFNHSEGVSKGGRSERPQNGGRALLNSLEIPYDVKLISTESVCGKSVSTVNSTLTLDR